MKSISPRILLLIIFAIFLLPLVLAWMMYSGAIEFEPEATRNRGILVEPPVPVSWDQVKIENAAVNSAGEVLEGHWTILYPLAPSCDSDCQAQVSSLRQIHRAAGRNQDRVRIALMTPGRMSNETAQALLSVYPKFTLISDPAGSFSAQLPGADNATYLIDPLGNIMMRYTAESDPNDLNKDLKQLLAWSKLDKQ